MQLLGFVCWVVCFLFLPFISLSLPLGVRAVWGSFVLTSPLYSSTASMSAWFTLAYLNSGRSSKKLVGTDSKLRAPRNPCISFCIMLLIIRSSRTVYAASIFGVLGRFVRHVGHLMIRWFFVVNGGVRLAGVAISSLRV